MAWKVNMIIEFGLAGWFTVAVVGGFLWLLAATSWGD